MTQKLLLFLGYNSNVFYILKTKINKNTMLFFIIELFELISS